MGKLFNELKTRETLHKAWRKIRANGLRSTAPETRIAIENFERTDRRDIDRIQRRLNKDAFVFDPQKGVTKKKSSGGKRGIVMASVHNRIVERALLDVLQAGSVFVSNVIETPTSIGGVPHRSVPHGLKLLSESFSNSLCYFVRSDISGFFDHIPRKDVLDVLAKNIDDTRLLKLLDDATTVTLGNESALGEDRRAFPTNYEGVAQGSPLSPLFGNILLHEFDKQFNDRGIVCIRFIDDFILLGQSEKHVRKAFKNAVVHLSSLGLSCHDPYEKLANPDKAIFGHISNGFDFLGYRCQPGLFQPSLKSRQSLLKAIDEHISHGRWSIKKVHQDQQSFSQRQRYVQTQVLLDQVIRGWGEAFSYGNAPSVINDLDEKIDTKLLNFRRWFSAFQAAMDWKDRRRIGGVGLLGDIETKSLEDVPFLFDETAKFRKSANTVTISVDGSIISGRRAGRDKGPGGWAFIVHDTKEEKFGTDINVTNNMMELRAVIEAVRFSEKYRSVIIRTDSRYVEGIFNRNSAVKSNSVMWNELRSICTGRKIRIVWVKGHAGDEYNERADYLANEAAKSIKAGLEKAA